jgi:hypothetical protein
MSESSEFAEESERIWVDPESAPQRVVDADPAPSPTYATPIPVNVTPPSRLRQFGHKLARAGVAVLLLLIGVVTWVLLALPAGALGCLVGLAVTGALIAGMLYAVRASFCWR